MQRYYIFFIYARKPFDFLASKLKKVTFKTYFISQDISSYGGLIILRQAGTTDYREGVNVRQRAENPLSQVQFQEHRGRLPL